MWKRWFGANKATPRPSVPVDSGDLAAGLLDRYRQTGELGVLMEAVTAWRRATAATPAGHPNRIRYLHGLETALLYLYERNGQPQVAREAVVVNRELVAAVSSDDPDRPGLLSNLGIALKRLYEQDEDLETLTEAVAVGRQAVAIVPADHPDLAGFLSNLGITLRTLFERTGELAALTEAVAVGRQAIAATPTDDPWKAMNLNSLGNALFRLFENTGELPVLAELVTVRRQAVVAIPADHPDRAGYLSHLGLASYQLFERTGDLTTLSDLVTADRQALAETPVDHPSRRELLSKLGISLQTLYGSTGELAVLAEAVTMGRQEVAATPANHPHRATALVHLGRTLHELFERTDELEVLTEAVTVMRQAVTATSTDHPSRVAMLIGLGDALQLLFERTGDLTTLNQAVTVGRQAMAADPTHYPGRSGRLANLAISLARQLERTGDLTTLNQAVTVGRAAVAMTPTDHPDMVACLSNLGGALRLLFVHTGDLAVIKEAVAVDRKALAAIPIDHPDRALCLDHLAATLRGMFERTRDLVLLTEAVAIGREAVAAAHADEPNRAMYLSNLGSHMRLLSAKTTDMALLTEAVAIGREAVAAAHTDDPDRAMYLINLGDALQHRFVKTGEVAMLIEAVIVGREAVVETPPDHPKYAGRLMRLGAVQGLAYLATGESAVLAEARQTLADAMARTAGRVSDRITAGRGLAAACMSANEPDAAQEALEAVATLVPQLAPRTRARPDREYGLGSLAGLAAEMAAAATAAGRPDRAVELLEQTRGVLLGEVIDARGDLSELRRAAPELAAELDGLRERTTTLDEAPDGVGFPAGDSQEGGFDPGWEIHRQQQATQHERLAEQWTALLDRIRAIPGFDQFLLPPPIGRLQRQAAEGPIVIVYASRERADALIITVGPASPVQVVPLPGLTDVAASEQAKRLLDACADADGDAAGRTRAQAEVHAVLGWLWDTISGPVLNHLGFTDESEQRPRIWWCPVGWCMYLPLHAAGHHTAAPDTAVAATVMDRVTSSYTTTIRALEYARRHRDAPPSSAGSALIVAMPTTPGASDLPEVAAETTALNRLLGSPETLIGPAAHYEAVAAALPHYRIAHFACHGLSNWAEPSASKLLLADHRDRPLTVAALSRLHLMDAELAYLSACSTTQTGPSLADEAIHITAAFHLAGYRRVIGTLWSIDDAAATRIATEVYASLTDGGAHPPYSEDSAYALAEAIRRLRDDHPTLPTHWAAHIHLGA